VSIHLPNLVWVKFLWKTVPPHTPHRLTQTWISASCPEFISTDEWPPNSLDLNPLDYFAWGAMLDLYQKYQPRPTTGPISEFKVTLQSIWNDSPQDPIDRSVLSFTKRLRACIKANGGHFEYRVWLTAYLLLQYAAPVVKYQQTDHITSTALFYVENALLYVVKFLKRLVTFVDDFDNL